MLSRKHVVDTVVKLVAKASRQGAAPTSATRPVLDCGLESADGVEIADELEEELGIEVPTDANPFFEEVKNPKTGRMVKRPRSIGQIADWLISHNEAK